MARITIDGIEIAYDLLGPEGAQAVAITPGGRFSKDAPGIPELAEALAERGRRVLIWDRPSCGASDISFDGESESGLHAGILLKLIQALDLGPTALAAGSAGSRVSLIAAALDPASVSHMILWWISGGVISLTRLASQHCADHAMEASLGGMAAVVASPGWSEQIERNPRNRDILMAQDPILFIETMDRWCRFYTASETTPVPGMTPEDFGRLHMPVLIYRSGKSDLSHTRRTSIWVHELIRQSELRDPPWPDEEWNNRFVASAGLEADGLFTGWPDLAPAIADFTQARA